MRLPRWAIAAVALCGVTQAAWADEYYGAIAYSPSTGSYGFSYGKDCQATAENVALSSCRGRDRQVVVWVSNGYAALAVNDDGGWGAAWSSVSQEDANQAAMDYAGGCDSGAPPISGMATGVGRRRAGNGGGPGGVPPLPLFPPPSFPAT